MTDPLWAKEPVGTRSATRTEASPPLTPLRRCQAYFAPSLRYLFTTVTQFSKNYPLKREATVTHTAHMKIFNYDFAYRDYISQVPALDVAHPTMKTANLVDISTSPPSSSSDEFPTSSCEDEDTATEDQVHIVEKLYSY